MLHLFAYSPSPHLSDRHNLLSDTAHSPHGTWTCLTSIFWNGSYLIPRLYVHKHLWEMSRKSLTESTWNATHTLTYSFYRLDLQILTLSVISTTIVPPWSSCCCFWGFLHLTIFSLGVFSWEWWCKVSDKPLLKNKNSNSLVAQWSELSLWGTQDWDHLKMSRRCWTQVGQI